LRYSYHNETCLLCDRFCSSNLKDGEGFKLSS
jgi:hypothetical protein